MTRINIVPLILFLLIACKEKAEVIQHYNKHQAEINYRPSALLYIDRFPVKKLLANEGGDTLKKFVAYKIGFLDSMMKEAHEQIKWNKYFDYEMQKDWKIISKGDSLPVVFTHSIVSGTSYAKEAIFVFEVNKNEEGNTLCYTDSYFFGKQFIITLKK